MQAGVFYDMMENLYPLFRSCSGVCTDTRLISRNTMFFALKGPNFNGNRFATQALEQGARYAVIDEKDYQVPGKTILVKNVLQTLQELATYHRRQWNGPILAITGSNGKTTTKELLVAVLSQKYRTAFTQGNLNNHIGVPLTLLSIRPEDEVTVVEMGANHIGEIDQLSKIAEPQYGLITNIGIAHLEGFGSEEGIFQGKTELFRYLEQNNGKALFVNANDPRLSRYVSHARAVAYGLDNKSLPDSFTTVPGRQASVSRPDTVFRSQLEGGHNCLNIAAAVTVGQYFGVSLAKIQQAIASYVPDNNRSQMVHTDRNQVLMDAYNANPTSMEKSIRSFSEQLKTPEEGLIIAGDMFELGDQANRYHRQIIDLIHGLGIPAVFVGKHFWDQKTGSPEGINAHFFETADDPALLLMVETAEGKKILVKGSRSMQLEKLLSYL